MEMHSGERMKRVRPVNTAGNDCPEGTPFGAKNLFENYQNRLAGFIRIPDFTNFPAHTGFLVMVKKELPVDTPVSRQRVFNKMRILDYESTNRERIRFDQPGIRFY